MKENHKNKCKKTCHNIIFGSTFTTAIFHFICCGLPALIALFGAIFGLTLLPPLNFLSATQRGYLLIIGGCLLAVSLFLFFRQQKNCDCKETMKWERIILFSSLGFFTMGVIFHIISILTLAEPACH